jgi:acetoin utilization deacetylase AcuC-like enzyme
MVDLDVHMGDGSAAIFEHDQSVFTFSIHGAGQAFPLDPPCGSNLDLALPAGTGDEKYLAALRRTLPRLLDELQPDLVLYNAGVDVAAGDLLGRLALSEAGIAARDREVLSLCAARRVPLAAAIGGGYDAEDHGRIVRRHVHLHAAASELAGELAGGGRAARAAAARK